MRLTASSRSAFRAGIQPWRATVMQTIRDLWIGGIVELAAGLAFYAVLCLFPLLIAGLILTSYVADPDWAARQAVAVLGSYLPAGQGDVEDIVQEAIASRQRVGLLSFAIFLVTGRRVLGALTRALNDVSDVSAREDTLRRQAFVELAMTAGLIVVGGLALTSKPLIRSAWDAARFLPGPDGIAVRIVEDGARAVLLFAIFAVVFAYVPRGERNWLAVLIGAFTAMLLLLGAHGVFVLLQGQLWPNLSLLYGPLALAALLLSWAWYVAAITLIGGSLSSHIKVMIGDRASPSEASQQHLMR